MTRRVLIKTARDGLFAATPHGEAAGASVLRELVDHPDGISIWRVIRLVTAWAMHPPQGRSDLLDDRAVEALLREIADDRPFDDTDPRGALVFILGEMMSRAPDLRYTALACLAVADWALANAAVEAALAYANAAALVAESARYAWVAGRLHREHSRVSEAEIWFQVAYARSARERDWEVRARSLMSWGHLHLNVGRYGKARDLFERALGTAKQFRLEERIGEAHHYLFTVARAVSDYRDAAKHSAAAARSYGPQHPRLPYFAHDLACYWMDRGDYQHALDVLLVLLEKHFADVPPERLLVTGSALRAAGGCGAAQEFERLLASFNACIEHSSSSPLLAQALLLAARGAISLRLWTDAEDLLVRAVDDARKTSQNDTRVSAEDLLVQVRDQSYVESSAITDPANDDVARVTVHALSGAPE